MLTSVKVINRLFMTFCYLKASKKLQKSYDFALRSFVNVHPDDCGNFEIGKRSLVMLLAFLTVRQGGLQPKKLHFFKRHLILQVQKYVFYELIPYFFFS